MKAISIRQPWAWAIMHAGKRVENREWSPGSPSLRSALALVGERIAIHAAKGCTFEEFMGAAEFMRGVVRAGGWKAESTIVPRLSEMPRGAIVATAKLADVYEGGFLGHRRHDFGRCSLCGQENPTQSELIRGAPLGGGQCPKRDPWAIDGSLWLILDDVRPLPVPVEFKGQLGFFEVPDGKPCSS